MDRKHQLQYCQQCKHQKFILEKGIVCSLTDEKPLFEKICKDYIEDPIAKRQVEEKQQQTELNEIEEESLGLAAFGIKNGVIAGQLAIFAAVLWLILGVIYMDRIFLYPFFLIFIGVVAWRKGVERKNKEDKLQN